MGQHINWKRSIVGWITVIAAIAVYSLTPETWSFFAAAVIVLVGWFIWDSMPKTIGEPDGEAQAPAANQQSVAEGDWSDVLNVISGSIFFGLLAALILPGIGDTFAMRAAPIYAMGIVLSSIFAAWAYRSHRLTGAVVGFVSFFAPIVFMIHHWYKVP